MRILFEFLINNPILAIALLILLLCVVVSLVKKLFKIALFLAVVFIASGGALVHVSHREIADRGKAILEKVEKEVSDKVKQHLGDKKKDTIREDSLKENGTQKNNSGK